MQAKAPLSSDTAFIPTSSLLTVHSYCAVEFLLIETHANAPFVVAAGCSETIFWVNVVVTRGTLLEQTRLTKTARIATIKPLPVG